MNSINPKASKKGRRRKIIPSSTCGHSGGSREGRTEKAAPTYTPCCSVAESSSTLCDPVNCSPPGSPVHGISQARILEWAAISFSRGSSWSRDQTQVSCTSCIADGFFATELPAILLSLILISKQTIRLFCGGKIILNYLTGKQNEPMGFHGWGFQAEAKPTSDGRKAAQPSRMEEIKPQTAHVAWWDAEKVNGCEKGFELRAEVRNRVI